MVSSGSIALGRAVLGLGAEALPLERSQAAAAVGQIRLARAYEEALEPHGITAAQVLLTLADHQDRRRYLNTRATLGALLRMGVLPVVNENDTVATDEIRYGDNDRLAAQVAVTVGADLCVLLSDVDGLYTADPSRDPAARRLDRVDAITPEIEAMAGDAGSGLSRGGMRTKVMAARTATQGRLRARRRRRAARRAARGAHRRRARHLVRADRLATGGAQALDRGDEARGRGRGGRRRRGSAGARPLAPAGRASSRCAAPSAGATRWA